jgi:acyl carrier protein
MTSADQILNDVAELIRTHHAREYSGRIDRDTRFFGDLGLASIDAVVLAERLETHYDRKLAFGELMADLGSRVDRDLRVGELTDFLFRQLN